MREPKKGEKLKHYLDFDFQIQVIGKKDNKIQFKVTKTPEYIRDVLGTKREEHMDRFGALFVPLDVVRAYILCTEDRNLSVTIDDTDKSLSIVKTDNIVHKNPHLLLLIEEINEGQIEQLKEKIPYAGKLILMKACVQPRSPMISISELID